MGHMGHCRLCRLETYIRLQAVKTLWVPDAQHTLIKKRRNVDYLFIFELILNFFSDIFQVLSGVSSEFNRSPSESLVPKSPYKMAKTTLGTTTG